MLHRVSRPTRDLERVVHPIDEVAHSEDCHRGFTTVQAARLEREDEYSTEARAYRDLHEVVVLCLPNEITSRTITSRTTRSLVLAAAGRRLEAKFALR